MKPVPVQLRLVSSAASVFLLGWASAQTAPPVTPQQFVKSEGITKAYTATNSSLQPADALQLALQCNVSINTTYDSNHGGKADTLRTYGFANVPADIYRLRGPSSLGTALQKAQLRAQGNAAEFFAGVRTAVNKSTSQASTQASGISNGQLQLGDLEVETMRASVNTNAEAVLRYGHATGTRLVSFGEQGGMCVVVRYELPLDQRPRQDGSAQADVTPSARSASRNDQSAVGIPLPEPGVTGDF